MSRVSVVITTYNDAIYLQECWTSILSQIYPPDEIFLVDDCSTDSKAIEILKDFRSTNQKVKFITNQGNLGLERSRNLAIEQSTCDYILCVDVDNKLHSYYLQIFKEVLDSHADISIVYCWMQRFGYSTNLIKWPAFSFEKLAQDNYIDACAMFRKSDWTLVGGFEAEYGPLSDWQFWIKIVKTGKKAKLVPLPLLYYRTRQDSLLQKTSSNRLTELTKLIRKFALEGHH